MNTAVLRWSFVDDVFVVCWTAGDMDPDELDRLIDELERSAAKRAFVMNLGASSMNSVQRRRAADAAKKKDINAVVLTDSAVTRGLLTAMSWLGANIQSRPIADVHGALEALGVFGDQRDRVQVEAGRLRAECENATRVRSQA